MIRNGKFIYYTQCGASRSLPDPKTSWLAKQTKNLKNE